MRQSLAALVLCVFGITTGEFVIAGILPDVAAEFGVSISAAGLLVTAYAVGMIFGGPVVTALTARYSRKPLISVLLLIAVAGNVASALAPSYELLFVARVVTALVTSTFFANAIVIATATSPPDKQASTVSKLVFGMNIAMVLGAPIGTLLGNRFDWRTPFFAIAAVCALGLVLVLRSVPEVANSGGSAWSELRVFGDRDVQLAIAVTAIGSAGVLMVFVYFAPLLTEVATFASSAVAVMLLVYGLGATVGNVVGGRLSDRSPKRAQLGLLVLLACALLLMWAVSGQTVLIGVMVFLVGALGFSVIPGMQARVLNTARRAPTLAIAVNASAYQLAAAFAGWFGGQVIDSAGLRVVYLVAAAVTVLGIAVSAAAWHRDTAESKRVAPVANSAPRERDH
ncbi:MFS transporter [Nocardia sp. NPDC056541]|uniref:MFS transporter n=1 Tax=Nocardia sp. NPDC056541 TaxID=3345860 RepID=UPI0036711292